MHFESWTSSGLVKADGSSVLLMDRVETDLGIPRGTDIISIINAEAADWWLPNDEVDGLTS